MKLQKKISVLTLIIYILVTYFTPLAYGFSSDEIINVEKSQSKIISSGVTHQNIKYFLNSGWLNVNVITVNLTNPYIKLDLITSPEGISNLTNVKSMTESSKAIAAINADFFDHLSTPGKGYPMGFGMKSGQIISTAYYEQKKFATLSMDDFKQVLYSYVNQSITLTSPNGKQVKASDINKISSSYELPVIYNGYWDKNSIGSSEKFPDMVEMIVKDGIVSEVRAGMPAIEIPTNGYVVSARKSGAKFLINNFQVGDTVQLDVKTTPDLSDQDFAISGGTMLVKDGKPAPFTHNISGLHPRSAIGTSADNKYLYMVSVDGRQKLSQGMTLEELAKLMIDIGAHNALNLDGGGSTQLVDRVLGTNNIEVINSPSEYPLRKVANSLGVFSTAPQGTLKGLVIDTIDTNIFVNTKREFTVKGYDEYYNPIAVNLADVIWSISGVKGSFTGNTLTAEEVGEGTITATIGNVTESLPVSILSSPTELSMSPKVLNSSVGKKLNMLIKGKNKNGYSAIISPSSLNWTLTNNIVNLSEDTFTATNAGNAIISCSLGKVTAYSGISVSSEVSSVVQPCEQSIVTFASYPTDVSGEVYASIEQKYSGQYSYKLSYDFTTTDKSRAAYIVFPDNSIILDHNATDIGVWVYNPSPKTEWLRAQLVDEKGSTRLIDLTKDLSWTGWKFIKVPLSTSFAKPLKLSRIYVVQVEPTQKSTGEIYIDDLTVFSKKTDAIKSSDLPKDVKVVDEAQVAVPFKSSSDSFQFGIMGKVSPVKTLLDKIYIQKLTEQIEKNFELSAFVGSINSNFYKTIKKPTLTAFGGNSSFTYKNSTFITLDDSKAGIRSTNVQQWKWFLNQLNNTNSTNVFILLPKPVLGDNFSDPNESKLFQNILAEYRKKTKRNVWVITGGNDSNVTMERGTRYISTSGLKQDTQDITASLNQSKYILVTVKGTNITYEIKKLF